MKTLQSAAACNSRFHLSLSPSKEEGGTTALGRDLLKPPSKGGFWRGSLVHRYLEALEWPGEATLDADALLALGAEVDPDEGRRCAAFGYLRKALAKPELRAALSRRAGSDAEEVWRERRFCVEIPGLGQCEGAFDRVVLTRDAGGQVTAAVIQDYKTDTVAADLLEVRVAHYAPQLKVYRRALAVMTGLAESAIEAELVFLSLGCVQTVGA